MDNMPFVIPNFMPFNQNTGNNEYKNELEKIYRELEQIEKKLNIIENKLDLKSNYLSSNSDTNKGLYMI